MSCVSSTDGLPSTAAESWADTLLVGALSGGTDPILSDGDTFRSEASTTGNAGDLAMMTGVSTFAGGASGEFDIGIGVPGAGGAAGFFTFEGAAGGASAAAPGGVGSA